MLALRHVTARVKGVLARKFCVVLFCIFTYCMFWYPTSSQLAILVRVVTTIDTWRQASVDVSGCTTRKLASIYTELHTSSEGSLYTGVLYDGVNYNWKIFCQYSFESEAAEREYVGRRCLWRLFVFFNCLCWQSNGYTHKRVCMYTTDVSCF